MNLKTIGMDLAKNVIQVHGADGKGNTVLRKQLKRAQVLPFFVNLVPCQVGMEACGSAHFWARKLVAMGHTVQLIPPQYVKPFVKRNKNDAADAEAICEAVVRPNMPGVPIKTVEQQAILSVHRARQGFVKARTAQANQIRGLLAEYGLVIPVGIRHIPSCVALIVDDEENELPMSFRHLLQTLVEHFKALDEQVGKLELEIKCWHRDCAASTQLATVPGVGPITASALVASIGDARNFKNGRQMAAWMGLVPRQHSTGGKTVLQGISKRGDSYLRTLLIHGARAVIRVSEHKIGADPWLKTLVARRNKNIAAVALANKNVRVIWSMLTHERDYVPTYAHA
ncbi:MAG: IS110 family transposase [Gammaproteobacteria bacterium]|nr:IS110 family transposase [Rhodocyclaceae bacterium]MBU3990409.1 IS110 family transposase [Gammaproteobacteria bacterium]MBU4004110.1 IS110 family transposase [Gammaproteobacteria bacterium]MBU4020357.1 IS110 family transposase [Gammaproteobacteria bacterium]MBU4146118.1 IS110 family transposase [Gammaproteobacteria bacterium]